MEEEVKWIKGFEGLYQVTSKGRILSTARLDRFNRRVGGELKQGLTGRKRDYRFVSLFKNGKGKQYYVHRLVAEAFIPNPDNKPCIDHIDNNKDNNCVENLRWVTPKENSSNDITLKRMKDMSYLFGFQDSSKNPFSRRVAMYSLDGNLIKAFDSIGQIEKEYGIRTSSISRVCRGVRKQTHGYVFKYISESKKQIMPRKNRPSNIKPICQLDFDGNVIAEYKSSQEAANKLGIYACNISKVLNGFEKTYKGYKWRYK